MARAADLIDLPLFKGLSSVELEEVASYLADRRVAAHTRIIEEGDTGGHAIYILLAGEVDVLKRGHHPHPHVIGTLAAPSVFGEVEVLARRPAIASVVASTDCSLAVMNRGVFDELTAASRTAILKVVRNLAVTLAYRLAATDERMAAFFGLGGPEHADHVTHTLYTTWRSE
jgi:CRP-like cAMP-binding protein